MMRSLVARILIVTMTSTFIPKAQSAMISTDSVAGGDRERILTLLERADVAAQLEAYGVNPSDAKARVAALNDAELAVLSTEIDKAYAGAGGGGGAFILAVATVILFVLLLPFFLGGILVYNIVKHKGSATTHP